MNQVNKHGGRRERDGGHAEATNKADQRAGRPTSPADFSIADIAISALVNVAIELRDAVEHLHFKVQMNRSFCKTVRGS